MTNEKPEKDRVAEKLQDALDRLHAEVKRVEIWAGALTGFSRPVPEYRPGNEKHRLPRKGSDGTSGEPTAPKPTDE